LLKAICYLGTGGHAIWGAALGNRSQGALLSSSGVGHPKWQPTPASDPVDALTRALCARITTAVVGHDTDDWPSYYDRLYALICKVVAQSNLSADAKLVLTKRLIDHVTALEKNGAKSKLRCFQPV
jgi:hypothetical protein